MTKTARNNSPTDKDSEKAYFLWLCGKVGVNEGKANSDRRELLWDLHQKEFIFSVPNDDNRYFDGLDLRTKFCSENEEKRYQIIKGSCTVLEMMIALCNRIDYSISDGKTKSTTDKWFWELITNLGLETYSDRDPHADGFRELNDIKLNRLLNRS